MQKTMKKVLSLVLSLLIIMPCVGIIPVNAEGLDRTELDAVIEQAKAINADDYVDVSALNAAVETVSSSVLNTQTKIDDATAKIELEIIKLEKINNREENTITARAIFDDGYSLRYEHYVTLTGAHGGENLDSGVSLVYANQTTTVKSAKAYVYADKYSTSSLKDLGLVGSARTYCHVGKWFGSYLSFNGVQLNSVSNGTKGQWQSLGNHTLDAELPEAGTETEYQLTLKALMWDESKNVQHNGIMGIDLSVDSYDTTALREAIVPTPKQRSMYTTESYEKYIKALKAAMEKINTPVTTVALDGEGALYENIAAAQTAYDNAAKELTAAYDNLELTVELDYTNFDAAVALAKEKLAESDKYVSVDELNSTLNTAQNSSYSTQTELDDMTAKIELEIAKLEKVKETTTVTTYASFTIPNEYSVQTTVTIDNVNGAVNVNKSAQPTIGKVNMTDDASAYVYTDLYKGTTISDFGLNPTIINKGTFVRANEIYLYFNDTSTVLYHFQQKDVGYNKYTSYGQKKQTIEMENNVPAKGTSETVKFYAYNTSLAKTKGWFGTGQNLYLTMASYDTTELRNAIDAHINSESSYTADSYNAYIDALKKAMNVINTPITTVALDGEGANYADIAAVQTAIDSATEELKIAYDNLELALQIDYTELNNAIDLAKSKIAEEEKYVSIVALKAVLNTATSITYADQESVDNMTAKLLLEIKKLELVQDDEENAITARAIFDDGYSLRYEHYVTLTGAHGGESLDSGVSLVYANQTTTVKSAKAYVYADKYSTSSLKDLGLVGSARTYCHVGKWFGSYLSFNGVQLNSVSNGTKGQWQSLGNHTLDAELPEAGTETEYQLTLKALMWDESKNVQHNGIMGIDLSVNSYDTTALREAIAKKVEEKSHYSVTSYAAYVEALENAVNVLNTPITTVELDGEGANYADIAAAQTAIDNAAKALDSAYKGLQKSFNIEYYSDGVLFKTQAVSYTDLTSTLITDAPKKPGYVFNGIWTATDGTNYTLDKIAHDFATEDGSSIKLYANFDEAIYTIKFVDGDGNVLQTSTAKYHETVAYNGTTPTKTTDDEFEYSFNGSWSPEIGLIEDDTTYVAQFDETPHNYKYTTSDKNGHGGECTVCGHKIENAHHHFESTEVTENGQKILKSVCKDCGYSVTVADYTVNVPAGCTVTKTMRTDISEDYVLVTIQAPLKSGVCYFVNWVDGNGNNVGTYRTYSFFLTGDCAFRPNYVLLEDYVNSRKNAEIASRVTGINSNDDGTYSIYTEHSVSTSVGSIVGHGVLYTTNAAYNNKNSLVYDNDNISKKAAKSSASTLTGLLEVKDNFTPGETVYARSYIVTTDGNVIYGDIKTLTVPAIETSSTDGTLSTELFDLTEINADGDETIDPTPETPTPEEPTNPAPQNPLDKLTSIFNKIVEFITMIIKFFKSWEVVK